MRRRGTRGQVLAARGIGEHVGERCRQIVLGCGDDAAQFGHAAPLLRQAGDMDEQTAQHLAGGIAPVRIAFLAGAGHQHVGERAGQTHHVRIVQIERIEPVRRLPGDAGDAERIDQEDILAGVAPGTGGDGIILALDVEHEGGARIIE